VADNKLEFTRGERINGRYEVIDRLDESPVGVTYRVKHLKSGKFIRLTMLDPRFANAERKDELIGAFQAARAFDHVGLPKLGELGDHEGTAYYTMEDFEGGSLRELLQEYKIEGRQFAVKEASQVLISILEALQAVHDSGHVLRALRPEYVLIHVRYVGPRRNFVARIKLLHAGFWDLVESGVLAEDEFTRGEAQYLAPELKGFEPVATPRTDVYSAGVIFYEMLTGTAPLGTFQPPTRVRPELPKHVDDIVELALAHASEDRYRTASDLVQDVRRIFQEPDDDDVARKPLMTPMGWGLGLLVVAATGVILYQTRSDPHAAAAASDAAVRAEVAAAYKNIDTKKRDEALAKAPPNMIYVPGGPYVAGRLHSEDDAPTFEPLAETDKVGPFLIDAFEYPDLQGATPVYGVTYNEAEKKCEDAGKRLCTEAEWEKACKGPASTVYSYGDAFQADACGDGLEDRGYPSGSHSECRSGWGVFDLSGNFREWTATAPSGKKNRRVVKGGLRHNAERGTRCAFFTDESVVFKDNTTGFRCCRDVDAPPWKPPEGDGGDGQK